MPLTCRSQDPEAADTPDERTEAGDVGSPPVPESADADTQPDDLPDDHDPASGRPELVPHPAPESPTELLPLFPLGTVLVPGMQLALHIFEPRYRQLVADLLSSSNASTPELGVVALRQGWEVGELKDLHEVGTVALVTDVLPLADGRCNLTAVGRRRFVIRSIDSTSKPYLQAQVHFLPESDGALTPGTAAAVRRAAHRHAAALRSIGAAGEGEADELPIDARGLSYAVARQSGLSLADRQAILAAADTASRLSLARNVLSREFELLRHLRAVPVSAATFRTPS